MASPDPAVVERQYWLDKLGIADDPDLSMSDLKSMTGGGARVDLAANQSAQKILDSIADNKITAVYNDTGSAFRTNLDADLNSAFATLPGPQKNALTGWFHVDGFGTVGDGSTDDTAAIQAVLDAAPNGGTIYFPDGIYKIDGTLTLNGSDVTVSFSGDAWLKPTAGIGLTVTGQRVHLASPRVRIDGGTPSAAIKVLQGTRVTITDPVVWAFANIAGTLDGIVVDDNSYWCSIERARFRKDSGTLTGTFRRCVSFLAQSNAGRVIGGDFTAATTGVYVDTTNATLIDGGSYEGVTDGIELGGTGSCGGTRIVNTRHEAGTNCVNITTTYLTNNAPIFIGAFSRISSVATVVNNPNGVAYTLVNGSQWKLMGNGMGDSFSATITLMPYISQTQNCFEVIRSGVRNFAVNNVGDVILSSGSAAFPANADTVGVVRHYNGTTTVAAVNPGSNGGSVALAVGNGSGGAQTVLSASAFNTSPGADNTQALGTNATRWTNAFFTGFVRVGSKSTASRPAAATAGAGGHIFDITLNKPIWSDGTNWRDATGTVV